MRIFRALVASLVALLLGSSLLGAAPAQAAPAPAQAAPALADEPPTRTIEWTTTQKTWRAFQLKGSVSDLGDGGKVVVEVRKCGKCGWKKFKKISTNDRGIFRTRILAPKKLKQRWFYRIKVNAQDGYAAVRSEKFGVWLKLRR